MEKISELGNNLQESVKINVEKNNGIRERFSYEKLVKSLVMVETPFFESDKIIATVVSQLYDGIKTKEIKKIVHECLEDIDPEIANKYLASTQLKVRTSEILSKHSTYQKSLTPLLKKPAQAKKQLSK